jgi:hypothetical protein
MISFDSPDNENTTGITGIRVKRLPPYDKVE